MRMKGGVKTRRRGKKATAHEFRSKGQRRARGYLRTGPSEFQRGQTYSCAKRRRIWCRRISQKLWNRSEQRAESPSDSWLNLARVVAPARWQCPRTTPTECHTEGDPLQILRDCVDAAVSTRFHAVRGSPIEFHSPRHRCSGGSGAGQGIGVNILRTAQSIDL